MAGRVKAEVVEHKARRWVARRQERGSSLSVIGPVGWKGAGREQLGGWVDGAAARRMCSCGHWGALGAAASAAGGRLAPHVSATTLTLRTLNTQPTCIPPTHIPLPVRPGHSAPRPEAGEHPVHAQHDLQAVRLRPGHRPAGRAGRHARRGAPGLGGGEEGEA